VFENRFLQSFCAVAASAVLVGGTLLLLTSTAPWSPPQQIDSEPSTPDAARLSAPEDDAIDAQFPGASLASDQADTTSAPELDEADRTYTASTSKQPDKERSQLVGAESPAPEGDDVAALGMPLNADIVDTDSEDVGADTVIALDAPASEGSADHETVALSEPAAPMVSDKSDAATDQIADVLTALPPAPPAPPAPVASDKGDAAIVEVAAVLAATKPAPAAVAVVAPPPPLPKRKPAEGPPAPKVAALAAPQPEKPTKPAETKPAAAQQEVAQPRGDTAPWKPMALAPADKPSIALSKAPTARPSGSAYASKVWSALARHKPKAGQRGSTTVVFAIGENGALRGLRVGRSSGNTRLDQLALATVRNAAPYPPPPSGAASYTIRIDFQ
jgi:protein TonB